MEPPYRRPGLAVALPRATAVLSLVLAVSCGPSSDGREPLSCILVTLDTTATAPLGFLGGPKALTPNLDALAAESVVYERAHTVAPLTLPSHASMLTGLVPLRHSVRDNGLTALPGAAETAAEALRGAGYATAAFLAAIVLEAPYGLDQGFDVYDAPGKESRRSVAEYVERDAHDVTGRALEWLRSRERGRPFFLWVHYFDPHAPHEPDERFLRQAGGDPYGGEIACMDDAVGVLVEALRRDGALEESLLVVVADHGESLGAHGETTHSVFCYEEVLHVPFLVRYPAGLGERRRSREPVGVVDVFPTLLEAAGLEPDPGLDGRSLFLRRVPEDRGLYFESQTSFLNFGWSPLVGWLAGETKYVHGTTPELFDLARDPREERNLLEEDPEASRAAPPREALRALAERPRLAPEHLESSDPARVEELRALGYAGGSDASAIVPEPLESTGLPDPRDRIPDLKGYYRAATLLQTGRTERAILVLRGLLEKNPGSTHFALLLANVLRNTGDFEGALEVLASIPFPGSARQDVQDLQGHCQEELGRLDLALEHFERNLELRPGDAHAREDAERVRRLQEEGDGSR